MNIRQHAIKSKTFACFRSTIVDLLTASWYVVAYSEFAISLLKQQRLQAAGYPPEHEIDD